MKIEIVKGSTVVKKIKTDMASFRQMAKEALASVKSDFAEVYDASGILRHVIYLEG